MGGKLRHILDHLWDLQVRDTPRGYSPDTTNIILVVVPSNVAHAEELFRGMGLKVVTGSRYLGGFIGEVDAKKGWMEGKVAGWSEYVETLAGVSCKHPKSVYSRLQKSIQQEWALLQQVTHGIGDAFGPVEKALWETFLPALFEVLG